MVSIVQIRFLDSVDKAKNVGHIVNNATKLANNPNGANKTAAYGLKKLP
jgi:hypothetical protein